MITVDYSLVAYRVAGLGADTCEHCVEAVRGELLAVPGVVGVDVDAAAGKVSVMTDGPVDAAAVRVAVASSGCDLMAC